MVFSGDLVHAVNVKNDGAITSLQPTGETLRY
jgi:hypothetical protein